MQQGAPDKMYFDMQTGLMVRSVNQRYTPDGVTEFTADVDDYTEVDGVKLPFTVRQTGASATFIIRFTEVHHNLQLTDAQFAKPPAEPACGNARSSGGQAAGIRKPNSTKNRISCIIGHG